MGLGSAQIPLEWCLKGICVSLGGEPHPFEGFWRGGGMCVSLCMAATVSQHRGHLESLEADDTDNQGYCIYGCAGEFKGIVFLIIGYDEYMILVVSGLDAFDEWPLIRVDDIYFVPLEEEVAHRHALASDNVPGAVFGIHAGTFDGYEEVCSLECRYHIALAVVFQYGLA